MQPLLPNHTVRKIHCLVLFTLEGQIAIQIANMSTTSQTVFSFFKQVIPKFIDKNKKRKITVVLDNYSVQKTKALKASLV